MPLTDNTEIFCLLVFKHCSVSKTFLLVTPQVRRLGVHMNVGRVSARTADPKSPKGHSISHSACYAGKEGKRGVLK